MRAALLDQVGSMLEGSGSDVGRCRAPCRKARACCRDRAVCDLGRRVDNRADMAGEIDWAQSWPRRARNGLAVDQRCCRNRRLLIADVMPQIGECGAIAK